MEGEEKWGGPWGLDESLKSDGGSGGQSGHQALTICSPWTGNNAAGGVGLEGLGRGGDSGIAQRAGTVTDLCPGWGWGGGQLVRTTEGKILSHRAGRGQ